MLSDERQTPLKGDVVELEMTDIDIKNILIVFDLVSQKGLLTGNNLIVVGELYKKLKKCIDYEK